MRQVWITKTGGPEVLELREAPDPVPGDAEILVRVEASGVNFADLMMRRGKYPGAPKPPVVAGIELAGTVQAVGSEVSAFEPGDEVMAVTRSGAYSSLVVMPEVQAFKRPEGMTAETGAALPINYLAAFQALVVMGGIRHAHELGGIRMRVLVHSAAGGVGSAAADIGRIYGVELYGSASPEKHDYLRQLGYDHTISSRDSDWAAEALELTGRRGFDLILDPLGGDNWSKSFDLLGPAGRLAVYGYSDALRSSRIGLTIAAFKIPWSSFQPFSLMNKNRGVLGLHLGRLRHAQEDVASWVRKLLSYYKKGDVRPHVDRSFLLEEAAAAHAYIEARENRGKVVLVT